MIEQAWNEYRGWAKRSRSLRASARRWNFWAMAALILTAFLGAAATFAGTYGASWPASGDIGRALACAAAIASALSLYVGRQALAVGAESGWLRARATAEAMQSECFRFAAGVGDYAPDKASDAEAANAFIERRKAIAARAAGDALTPEDDPVGPAGDDRRPPRPMSEQWYLSNRIGGQVDFYQQGQEKNEHAYRRLQLWSFVAGALVAAVSAGAAFYGPGLAVWTSMFTTIGAAVGAYGLAERQKYLAASYAAMKANLERIRERFEVGGVTLQALVAAAEDLIESEHAAWIDRMSKTMRSTPPPPKPGAAQPAPREGAEFENHLTATRGGSAPVAHEPRLVAVPVARLLGLALVVQLLAAPERDARSWPGPWR